MDAREEVSHFRVTEADSRARARVGQRVSSRDSCIRSVSAALHAAG